MRCAAAAAPARGPAAFVLLLASLSCVAGHTRTFGDHSYAVPAPKSGGITQVWTTAASHRLTPDHAAPTQAKKGFTMSAARNEYEPLQIVCKASATEEWLAAVSVNGIDAANITLHQALYDTSLLTYELEPLGNRIFRTKAGQNAVLWATVYVPTGTAAGVKSGSVRLTDPTGTVHTYALELTVFDFTLSGTLNFMNQFTVSFANVLKDGDKRPDDVKKFLHAHRITPKGGATWPSGFNPKITWETSRNPDKCSKFYDEPNESPQYSLRHLAKKFLDGTGWNCAGFPWHMALQFVDNNTERPSSFCGVALGGDAKGTAAYNTAWAAYLTALRDYLVANGWQDKVYYYVQNEPQNQKDYDTAVALCKLARDKAPGLKLCVSEEPKPEIAEHCAFDIWAAALGEFNRTYAFHRLESGGLDGEQVWLYSLPQDTAPLPNPATLSNPGMDTRIWGFLSWAERTRGYWYYNARVWFSNGNPTVQLEMFREAAEDYEYLWLMNGKAHPKPCTKTAADTTASSLATTLRSWTKSDDALMSVRHEMGRYISGDRTDAPVLSKAADAPVATPADVRINFQDPAGQPTANPLVIGGKTWKKMGWQKYDEETGIGWKGQNVGKSILKHGYKNAGGKDDLWYSFIYDDYGKVMQFSHPVNLGRYDVTVAVGYPGRSYDDRFNVLVNGVPCIANYHSKATGVPQTHATVTVDLTDGALELVVGGRDNTGKDAYTFLAWVSAVPAPSSPPSPNAMEEACSLLKLPVRKVASLGDTRCLRQGTCPVDGLCNVDGGSQTLPPSTPRTPPPPPPGSPGTTNGSSGGGLGTGAIVGLSVGVVVALFLVAGAVGFVLFRGESGGGGGGDDAPTAEQNGAGSPNEPAALPEAGATPP